MFILRPGQKLNYTIRTPCAHNLIQAGLPCRNRCGTVPGMIYQIHRFMKIEHSLHWKDGCLSSRRLKPAAKGRSTHSGFSPRAEASESYPINMYNFISLVISKEVFW